MTSLRVPRKSRQLQPTNTQKFADHYPIHVELKLLFRYRAHHGAEGDWIPWDRDKLMNGVKKFEHKTDVEVRI